MARLLKTAIMGATVEIVASSWMDMLAGYPGDRLRERRPPFGPRPDRPPPWRRTMAQPLRTLLDVASFLFYLPLAAMRPMARLSMQIKRYLSSQTSSMRQPL